MNRPGKKRKSLLSQQAALAGISFTTANTGEANSKGPGTNFLPRISDLSIASTSSNLVTPLSRGHGQISSAGRGSGQMQRTRIPTSTTQASSSATARAGTSRIPPSSGRTITRVPPQSHFRAGRPPTRSGGNMRRSISMESFAIQGGSRANFTTPRNRSQSPGPGSVTRNVVPKVMKVPTAQDKTVVHSIIEVILNTLQQHGFGKNLNQKSFRNLTGKELHNIFLFLLEFFIGPNEGPGKKADGAYIHEGLQFLNCPVGISSSQLKSLNTQHTLPTVYSAMAWLCCYLNAYKGDAGKGCQRKLDQEFQKLDHECEVEELKWEIYDELFQIQWTSPQSAAASGEAALNSFGSKLVNIYGVEEDVSLEDLKAQVEEKTQCRNEILATQDPRASVQQTMKNQDELLAHTRKHIAGLEAEYQKRTDMNALESELAVVNSELIRRKRQLQSLVDEIGKQPLTKDEAEVYKNQTETLKKEQASLQKVIEELRRKLGREEQFKKNNMERFYEVCANFSILESYNNAARNWQDIPQISMNPFDVDTMETWVQDTRSKLSSCKRRLEEEYRRYQENIKSSKRTEISLVRKLEGLQEEYDRLWSDLSFKRHEEDEKLDLISAEIEAVEEKIGKEKQGIAKLEPFIAKATKDSEELSLKVKDEDEYLEEAKQYKRDLDVRAEELAANHAAAGTEVESEILAFVTEARAQVNAPVEFPEEDVSPEH